MNNLQRSFAQVKNQPEFSSLETFAQFLRDDERQSFTHEEVTKLAFVLQKTHHFVIERLRCQGFSLEIRQPIVRVRGFTTSSNDRWYGPGSGT